MKGETEFRGRGGIFDSARFLVSVSSLAVVWALLTNYIYRLCLHGRKQFIWQAKERIYIHIYNEYIKFDYI